MEEAVRRTSIWRFMSAPLIGRRGRVIDGVRHLGGGQRRPEHDAVDGFRHADADGGRGVDAARQVEAAQTAHFGDPFARRRVLHDHFRLGAFRSGKATPAL